MEPFTPEQIAAEQAAWGYHVSRKRYDLSTDPQGFMMEPVIE